MKTSSHSNLSVVLLFFFFGISLLSLAQKSNDDFVWPSTPASAVYKDFLKAYNSGDEIKVEAFVRKHYPDTRASSVNNNVEHWMDFYYRFGEVEPYAISIDRKYDLEVWLQGKVSKEWFAPEFILNEETNNIRAVGILQGELPANLELGSMNEDEMLKKLENYLSELEKNDLFQGTVLLQGGKGIMLKKAYGHKNLDKNILNSIDTRMRISSITKMITAVACLQLVQKGLLELQSPVSKYLPELPSHISNKITIEDFLNHTSGYELDGIKGFREEQEKTISMQEVYNLHLKYLPEWEYYDSFNPSGGFNYSNDSYDLIAVIIEKVTSMNYEEYIEKHIFNVVGMTQTSFDDYNSATPYRYDLEVKRLQDYSRKYPYSLGKISGAGGLFSTVDDLRLFFNSLLNTDMLLNEDNKSLMFSASVNTDLTNIKAPTNGIADDKKSPQCKLSSSRSLGLTISNDPILNFGHNGTSIGNSAELRYFPDLDYLLIILCNNRSGAQITYNYFKQILPNDAE